MRDSSGSLIALGLVAFVGMEAVLSRWFRQTHDQDALGHSEAAIQHSGPPCDLAPNSEM